MVMSIIAAVTLTFYLSLNIVQFTLVDEETRDYDAIDWDECGCHDIFDEAMNATQTICVNCGLPLSSDERVAWVGDNRLESISCMHILNE